MIGALALGALALTQTASAQSSQDAMVRDLSVVQKPAYAMAPPRGGKLKVISWLDHEDATYRSGQNVRVSVKVNTDAYITVVNIGPSGTTTVLFPNDYAKKNFVKAGQVLTLPKSSSDWDFKTGEPGVEIIKVFASTSAKSVFSGGKFQAAGPFRTADESGMRDIAVVLNSDKKAEWTVDTKTFRVVRAKEPAPGASAAPLNEGTEETALAILEGLDAESAFDLDVDVNSSAYAIGDALKVKVVSERNCNLTLLNVGSSGDVTVLFPNKRQRRVDILAGETVLLPNPALKVSYQVRGPRGREQIVAVCTAGGKRFLEAEDEAEEDFREFSGGASELKRDLAVVAKPTAGRQVAYAAVSYRVR